SPRRPSAPRKGRDGPRRRYRRSQDVGARVSHAGRRHRLCLDPGGGWSPGGQYGDFGSPDREREQAVCLSLPGRRDSGSRLCVRTSHAGAALGGWRKLFGRSEAVFGRSYLEGARAPPRGRTMITVGLILAAAAVALGLGMRTGVPTSVLAIAAGVLLQVISAPVDAPLVRDS